MTMTTNESKWQRNYLQLKEFIETYGCLPNKKRVEKRALLNWWKYNRKQIKLNKITDEHKHLLQELSDMRTSIKKPESKVFFE